MSSDAARDLASDVADARLFRLRTGSRQGSVVTST